MQQLQQSSLDFIPLQLHAEQRQIHQHISLLVTNLDIDQSTFIALRRQEYQCEHLEQTFCQIISSKMPQKKIQQQKVLETLTLCFYQMILFRYQYLQQIESRYENYLSKATYLTNVILFHEEIRKLCRKLQQTKLLGQVRKKLYLIMAEMNKEQDERLDYLKWKMDLCSLILELIFGNAKIQRSKVIYLLKRFKGFKQLNLRNKESLILAFKFIVEALIASHSELYQFFYRELKTWKDQIEDVNMKQKIKNVISKCQNYSSQGINSMLNTICINRKHQSYANVLNMRPKIIHNRLISNERVVQSLQNTPRSSHRVLKRRLSNSKSVQQFKKVDIFLKSREGIKARPSSNEKQKVTAKEVSANFLTVQKPQFYQSRQKFKSLKKKQFAGSFNTQKSFLGTFGRKFRKRMDVYNKIKDQRTQITKKNLADEKYQINYIIYERTRITKEEILVFNNHKQEEALETHTFQGQQQDLYFDTFSFSFYTIFNSEYAQIQITVHNQKSQFLIACKISSTYCLNSIDLKIQSNSHELTSFSVEELQKYIIRSPIYYEALQEKIERKISVLELQAVEQVLKNGMQVCLGKSQLAKILLIINIIQRQFFWYYGKSCLMTGNRLQKRSNINFQNLSTFAVSLGKFKSDYFSCLDEIQVIQNVSSIVQTCVYLSHGRMIVHKQFRLIKGKFYLEVIQISKKVYKSFSIKLKKSFFNDTMLKRKLVSFQAKSNKKHFNSSHYARFDLKQCLDEQNTFIFFMKNIVQNMIQKKYLKQIEKYLQKLSLTDNFEYFSMNDSDIEKQYALQVINNDLQANQVYFKEYFNSSIINLRYSIRIYCEAYKLSRKFKIISQKEHLMKMNGKFYIVKEVQLENQLKILQVYHNKSRSTYKLFFYHEQPQKLIIIKTPFQNRLSFAKGQILMKNLARKQIQQKFIEDDNIVLIKKTMKYKNSYCFMSLTECQSLSNYRIDYYFPTLQEQFSVYFGENTFIQYFGKNKNHKQYLSSQIKKIMIDGDKKFIQKNKKPLILFKSLGKMTLEKNKLQGQIELIMSQQGLKFLLIDYTTNSLSVGSVEDVKLNNIYSFSSVLRNKSKIEAYQNIMLRLYNQLKAGQLSFQTIDHTYFQKE